VHVTLRAARRLPSLRSALAFAAICPAIRSASDRRFRVVHFSAQTDHLHLIVEASSRERLIRGIQGLAGRLARVVNGAWRRKGDVWNGAVRNALVYVLLNFRKHLRATSLVDPCSSGPWFDGWARPPRPDATHCPVAAPRTWLVATGWRRAGGPIHSQESPVRGTDPYIAPGTSGRFVA
jgi:putative transposase